MGRKERKEVSQERKERKEVSQEVVALPLPPVGRSGYSIYLLY